MKNKQVCVCLDNKTHTTEFKDLLDVKLTHRTEETLGANLEDKDKRIEELEKRVEVLTEALSKYVAITSLMNNK